ncbi:hypothetical protein EDB89DRAFT_1332194 [Lactarius sanguifluus]|nr:hypothetical protein EDB89DRAFT_1332194 [Lactarius sanguifluus]
MVSARRILSSASCVVLVPAPPDQATSDVLLLALRRVPVHRALTVVPRGARLGHDLLLLSPLGFHWVSIDVQTQTPPVSHKVSLSRTCFAHLLRELLSMAPLRFGSAQFHKIQSSFLHMGPAALVHMRSPLLTLSSCSVPSRDHCSVTSSLSVPSSPQSPAHLPQTGVVV